MSEIHLRKKICVTQLVNLMKEILLQYLLHILRLIHKQGFPFQWKTVLSELPVNKKYKLVST